MKIKKLAWGPGFWKLNNSLLDDEEYVQKINEVIESIWNENQNIADLRVRFDFLKYKIMQAYQKYAKGKSLKLKEFCLLEKKLNDLDTLIVSGNASDGQLRKC